MLLTMPLACYPHPWCFLPLFLVLCPPFRHVSAGLYGVQCGGRGGAAMLPLAGRGGMLMLTAPSTCARYYFLVPPKGKCCPAPGLHLCSWSWGRCFQPGALQGQPVPHRSSPQAWPPPHRTLCPHIPGLCSPTSLHRLVQPRYSGTQIPPPVQSHNLVLLSASP